MVLSVTQGFMQSAIVEQSEGFLGFFKKRLLWLIFAWKVGVICVSA